MMQNIEIRAARLGDVPAILPFIKESWARTYDPVIGVEARRKKSGAKHVPALFEGEINDPYKAGIVAFAESAVVGYVGGEMRGKDCFFVDHLHVAPDWQGKGVAGALMDTLRQHLHDSGINAPKCIELTVLSGNERAFGFYYKQGFVNASGENEDDGLGGRPSQLLRWEI